jgi:energy-coupling factor transport system permease protein
MSNRAGVLTTATWWWLGLALALLASLNSFAPIQIAICSLSIILIAVYASPAKRNAALRNYGLLTVSIVVIRLIFRVIFNTYIPGQNNVMNLPEISLHFGALHFAFMGPVSDTTILAAFNDGVRLSAIIFGVAMANTIANPRKLLRSTPSALYEVATAAAVAVNLAPQMLVSIQRVRRARLLRGQGNRLRHLSGLVIPVLEDTIARSLDLAASMDSRGFGRRGILSSRMVAVARIATLLGIVLLGLASYLLLATNSNPAISFGLVAIALLLFASSLRIWGTHSVRTKLVLERRGIADYLVLALAFGALAIVAGQSIPALQLFSWLR